MKLFLNINKLLVESQPNNQSPKLIDEIDEIENTIDKNIKLDVQIPKDVLNSFKIKDSLNPEIWIKNKLNPIVKNKLIRIANGFYKELNLSKDIQIKDIIFTGSLANFNWSKFSDIDLHLVIDFKQFNADTKLVEDFFYAQKSLWNQEHDIEIYDYPVEIYVQDINDTLRASAIYSVMNDKWIKKPTREDFQIDKKTIKNKANYFIKQLRDIRKYYTDKEYQLVVDKVSYIKNKIKQMRNAGLEKGGEFSLENLVFKVLRRTPFMELIDSYKAKAYDTLMSVSETNNVLDENIVDEGEILDNTTFKYKKENESDIAIMATYDYQHIGSVTISPMANAYWYFKDEISEDKYLELFPNDELLYIPHLLIPLDKHKGEGVAKELMKRAINKGKQLGFTQITLNASPMGTKGLEVNALEKFYESLGFKTFLHQGNNALMVLNLTPKIEEDNNRKIKKDLETKLGRRLPDNEWSEYLQNGKMPKPKTQLTMDSNRAQELYKRQEEIKAKIDSLKNKRN